MIAYLKSVNPLIGTTKKSVPNWEVIWKIVKLK